MFYAGQREEKAILRWKTIFLLLGHYFSASLVRSDQSSDHPVSLGKKIAG